MLKLKNEEGIKVLGTGCAKCIELENNIKLALDKLGLNLNIDHTDFVQISSYGVMSTLALVLDAKVISYVKVLTVEEVKKFLEGHK